MAMKAVRQGKTVRQGLVNFGMSLCSAAMLICAPMAVAQSVGMQIIVPGMGSAGEAYGEILLGSDGYLYGTGNIAVYGGPSLGVYTSNWLFNSTTTGNVTQLYVGFYYEIEIYTGDFAYPSLPSKLVQAPDASFYGTTEYEQSQLGGNPYGSVFEMSPSGQVSELYYFSGGSDGKNPLGSLVQGSDGRFYGTTSAGGTGSEGTIFAITSSGVFTTLHTFSALDSSGHNVDGAAPKAGLYLASDGNFYGTTSAGGTYGYGTIFKLTPSGAFTVMRSLNISTDGANPTAPLYQASDGYLYGTAVNGGSYGHGTVFKISTTGTFTNLHSFALSDGANPAYGLVESKIGFTDYLLGSAPIGGAYNDGLIYSLTTGGKFSVLYTFNGAVNGHVSQPQGLTLGPDSNIYGVAGGTVFELITQKPKLTLKVSPATVVSGQSATITWSTTSATSCTASGSWSGSEPTSGSQLVTQTTSGSFPYSLSCAGPAGGAKKTVYLRVK